LSRHPTVGLLVLGLLATAAPAQEEPPPAWFLSPAALEPVFWSTEEKRVACVVGRFDTPWTWVRGLAPIVSRRW
jgi:hypothetical protein